MNESVNDKDVCNYMDKAARKIIFCNVALPGEVHFNICGGYPLQSEPMVDCVSVFISKERTGAHFGSLCKGRVFTSHSFHFSRSSPTLAVRTEAIGVASPATSHQLRHLVGSCKVGKW